MMIKVIFKILIILVISSYSLKAQQYRVLLKDNDDGTVSIDGTFGSYGAVQITWEGEDFCECCGFTSAPDCGATGTCDVITEYSEPQVRSFLPTDWGTIKFYRETVTEPYPSSCGGIDIDLLFSRTYMWTIENPPMQITVGGMPLNSICDTETYRIEVGTGNMESAIFTDHPSLRYRWYEDGIFISTTNESYIDIVANYTGGTFTEKKIYS